MGEAIIGLREWFETPLGAYLLAWEQAQMDNAVADIFGYHALQLGLPQFNALQGNRMPHQWVACQHAGTTAPQVTLVTEFSALPFAESSLDLLVLPHGLDLAADSHAALREVARVLVPEGRVVISGFNPVSLWGLRQRRARRYVQWGVGERFLPEVDEMIGYWRLRDWLRLLSFEVESSRFGCYRPALDSAQWLDRLQWMDRLGERWWPILGAVYFVVAVKRVRGLRLLGPAWKAKPGKGQAPATIANKVKQGKEF